MPENTPLPVDEQALLDEAESKIRTSGKRLVTEILSIGETLVDVKSHVLYGRYREFVTQRLGWPVRTAQRFVSVYQMFCKLPEVQSVDGKSDKLSAFGDLQIPITALYRLAQSSTPEEVRAQVLEKAKQPGGISLRETREMILQVRSCADIGAPAKPIKVKLEPWTQIRPLIPKKERSAPDMTVRDMKALAIREAEQELVRFETRFWDRFGHLSELTPDREPLRAARDKIGELSRDYSAVRVNGL
jgi:hypothetical protein